MGKVFGRTKKISKRKKMMKRNQSLRPKKMIGLKTNKHKNR